MTPTEVMRVLERKRPKTINGIHEDVLDQLLERRERAERAGVKVL